MSCCIMYMLQRNLTFRFVSWQGEWHAAPLVAQVSVMAAPDGNPNAANSLANPEAITVKQSAPEPFVHGTVRSFPPMSVTIMEFTSKA